MPELICIVAILPLLAIGAILWSMLGGVAEAQESRARWGSTPVTLDGAGQGAYREGALVSSVPRAMPLQVALTGVSGLGLAMLTGLGLAPCGLVLCGLIMGPTAVRQPFGAMLFVGSLSGLSLAIVLHGACRSLLRSEREAGRSAKRVAVYSFVHHVGMAALFLCGSMFRTGDLVVAAVPAVLGAAHAVMLYASGRLATQTHNAMSAEEQQELPALGS